MKQSGLQKLLCYLYKSINICQQLGGAPGAVVKAACLKSRRFEPHSDIQASKKQNVSFPLTRNYSKQAVNYLQVLVSIKHW